MKANFRFCLDMVLHHEGGYSNHPDDPGGATNMGITQATLRDWSKRDVTKDDVEALTRDDVAPIYLGKYWTPVRGDDLPGGVDLAVFDFAVNSGTQRAIKALQECAGVTADGVIGPITMAAVKKANAKDLIFSLCIRRMNFLQRLRHWVTFGRGWSRRVRETLEASWEMAR